ncbi:hypothetical protein SAMN05192561_103138 [Halopenitus malekzadehii]|uniref:Putative nickel insertion protein n=1 Tax=Halopenitus malekzadehii TaxID=1267564 RepID=A0A1H6IK82_9EURY|nr:nickel pincer cofactor biosynthesis protein LarC [Halopenitus malekzadehii]SEH49872.1 hypothetical protein SAMN05192561_103138 [Halopenitus malekzadehii]
MDTLAFDGRTGAAGDMICAALIAAGADPAVLEPLEAALPVRFVVDETTKNGIRATTVDVLLTDEEGDVGGSHDDRFDHDGSPDHDHSHDHPSDHSHGHSHDHTSDHSHGHSHDHTSEHGDEHAEGAGVHRTYPEVVDLLESMDLPADVEANALAAFELLGEGEAAVHGTALAETHFHEVGADDAVADVVGACLLLADLGVDRVLTGPIAAGGGEVRMSHGVYPVPAPAVVEIAERAGLALAAGPVDAELLTPTGAAILGAVADPVDSLPALSVETAGYGAGTASFPDHPNVLRTIGGTVVDEYDHGHGHHDHSHHGHSHHDYAPHDHDHTHHPDVDADTTHSESGHDPRLTHDAVTVLETTLDDVPPEVLGGLQETLSAAGARDVTIVPTTMKKSRPGHLVTVICPPADADAVAERLARETGTLGIRETAATHRWIADRSFRSVTIEIDGTAHDVTVKLGATADGDVYDVSAEYDDAAAVAADTGLPIREVMRRAETAVRGADERDDRDPKPDSN